jgi:hypothetical protein
MHEKCESHEYTSWPSDAYTFLHFSPSRNFGKIADNAILVLVQPTFFLGY